MIILMIAQAAPFSQVTICIAGHLFHMQSLVPDLIKSQNPI